MNLPERDAAVPIRHTVASFDGHPVAAWDFRRTPHGGSADLPVVVLAHANGFHTRAYSPLVAALAGRAGVVGFDLRGQGHTAPPADLAFDWNRFAADALAVADYFALRRPVGVGHSSGGAALALAEERRPGSFAALFLYEPILFPSLVNERAGIGNVLAQAARKRRQVYASRAEAHAKYAAKPPFSNFHPDALAAYVEHGFEDQPDGTVILRARGDHEARVYESELDHDGFEHLDTIGCPVTVAHGEFSLTPPIPMFVAAGRRVQDGRIVSMPGLGHLGPFEDPAAVAAAIGSVLDALPV